MIHHIPYPIKFFKEMNRILNKNGKLKTDAIKSACVVNANKFTGSDFFMTIAPNE